MSAKDMVYPALENVQCDHITGGTARNSREPKTISMIQRFTVEELSSIEQLPNIQSLLPNYRPEPGRFDPFSIDDPAIITAWLKLLTQEDTFQQLKQDPNKLSCIGEHITERWRSVKLWLQEHSASLTSHTDDSGKSSWELDPIPLMMLEKQWLPLAAAIAQRARLIDVITRDLYGPQRLLAEGHIPMELVYGAKQYLPSMQASIRAGEPAIYLYATQLCQDASGKWFALADRTQGPSGCGHTLENRIALSRVLAEEFQSFYVQRSASFFATLRDTISAYANMRQPDARTVLLSPGVHSRTYFEDAYLARYLGYTLTQAEDLTVRGGQVYRKTLAGLIKVQSILRRVQDEQCDPLELNSKLGVAGLFQAIREGNVAVVNPIGCGWAEMPAVAVLLAKLCPIVLGEELLLPTVPMHWCGDADSQKFVCENIDRLEIRDALSRHEFSEVHAPGRSSEDNAKLVAKIKAEAWKYVAVEPIRYGSAAVWSDDQIEPWPMVMRVFATLNEDRYSVLPGGVARLAARDEDLSESLACGVLSKDVWIVGTKPPNPMTLRKPLQRSVELRRSSFDLASRVAETLYWLGRSTQRAESMIRHARTIGSRLIDNTDLHLAQSYAVVFDALDRSDTKSWDEPLSSTSQILKLIRQRLLKTLYDPNEPNSLNNVLWSVDGNMSMVRDRLSLDGGQLLSELTSYRNTTSTGGSDDLGDMLYELNAMLRLLSAFSGMVAENMTRGPGWLFLDLGIRIERTLQQTHLLQSLLFHDYAWMSSILESLLEIMDSVMTYRFRYLIQVEIDPTVDLLLVDESNPRAVAFQLTRIDELLTSLQSIDTLRLSAQRDDLNESRAAIRLIDADMLCTPSADARDLKLPMIQASKLKQAEKLSNGQIKHKSILDSNPELLASNDKRYALYLLTNRIEYAINELHNYLSDRFFVHTANVQRLGE